MQKEFVLSGVGGQGILVASQLLGHAILSEGRRSMYFSMFQGAQRGGICECLVVDASERVEASPVIMQPLDACLAMHPNSFLRFERWIDPGGLLVYNTSLKFGTTEEIGVDTFGMNAKNEIELQPSRRDVRYLGIPATELAIEKLDNVMQATLLALGAFIEVAKVVRLESALERLPHALPIHRHALLPLCSAAIQLGSDWARANIDQVRKPELVQVGQF